MCLLALITAGIYMRHQQRTEQLQLRANQLNIENANEWTHEQAKQWITKHISDERQKKDLPYKLESEPEVELKVTGMLPQVKQGDDLLEDFNKQGDEIVLDQLIVADGYTYKEMTQSLLKMQQDEVAKSDKEQNALSTHLTFVVIPHPNGQAQRGALVLSHREEMFTPEVLSEVRPKVQQIRCKFCKKTFRWMPTTRHLGSFVQTCLNCEHVVAMVAADNQGHYRYVNEFLTGYSPPAFYPSNNDALYEVNQIWQTVWEQTRYVRDERGKAIERDCWQPSHETMARGTGDCEDSSFLLADWLISRGFEAKVAMGMATHGKKVEGHAWVVVRVNAVEYLLESTVKPQSLMQHPPYVTSTLKQYLPRWLVDRDSMYVLRKGSQFISSYWGGEWLQLPSRKRPPQLCWKPSLFDLSLPERKGRPVQMLKPILPEAWAKQQKTPVLAGMKLFKANEDVWQLE
jgi:predicted transglutaminase-like cysteine proteinase